MELSAPALDAELARIVDPHGLAFVASLVLQVAGGESAPPVLKRFWFWFWSCSSAVWLLAITAPLITGLCTSGRARQMLCTPLHHSERQAQHS